MSRVPRYDPMTSEARSPLIAGLTEACNKISGILDMKTATMTNFVMPEIFISEDDRYRMYQAPLGNKLWLETPAPVIKKNGVVIEPDTDGFSIDYLGGSICFEAESRLTADDTITVDATYIVDGSNQISSIITALTAVEGVAGKYKQSFATVDDLTSQYPTGNAGDYAIVQSEQSIYIWSTSKNAWVNTVSITDLSDYYTMDEVDSLLSQKENSIVVQGTTATSDNYYYGGRKTWVSLFSKVLGTVLTGLDVSSTDKITATDSILTALGKLQGQITNYTDQIKGTGAPTTSTSGVVGQDYINTSNGDIYHLVSIENGSYIWKKYQDIVTGTSGTQVVGFASNGEMVAQADVGLSAYTQANNAYNRANSAYSQANNAYNQANTATTSAASAAGIASNAYTQANTATSTASSAYGQANNAFNKANSASTTATSAYAQANTATTSASTAATTASSAYTQANKAFDKANSAATSATSAMQTASAANGRALAALNVAQNINSRLYNSTNFTVNIGYNANVGTSVRSTVVGSAAYGSNHASAFGMSANASGLYSVAVGKESTASGGCSVSIAFYSNAKGTNSIAIGAYSNAVGTDSISIGPNATVNTPDENSSNCANSMAIGLFASVTSSRSTAIGYHAKSTNSFSISLGDYASTTNQYSTALGTSSNASGLYSIALGYSANASGRDSIALGRVANASGPYSIATGNFADASGNYSISIGYHAKSNTAYSVALGHYSNSYGARSIAIGMNVIASLSSIALGESSKAISNNSTALGAMTNVSGINSTAIGYYAIATDPNAIQLGNNSSTSSLRCKVALTTTSDIRDKTDIEPIDKSVDFLNRLKAITYVWNGRQAYEKQDEELTEEEQAIRDKYGFKPYDKEAHARGEKKGERRRTGIGAQNIIEALKQVYGSSDVANIVDDNLHDFNQAEIPEGVESYLTVAYTNFIPYLIRAIQELDERVKTLEERLERLNE